MSGQCIKCKKDIEYFFVPLCEECLDKETDESDEGRKV